MINDLTNEILENQNADNQPEEAINEEESTPAPDIANEESSTNQEINESNQQIT
ncbi:hypothetical protein J5893_00195 [bacterium]|nr:hypothetical protein [bacterium]